jgi:hypothetical protein
MQITIQEQKNNISRGVHHFTSSIHQDITPKTICKREKDTKNSQEGANFNQVLLTMGELSYEMRFT